MLRVAIITFSPAGTTRKVGAMLAAALDDRACEPQLVDMTRDPAYFAAGDRTAALDALVAAHDVLCIGGPVYAHQSLFDIPYGVQFYGGPVRFCDLAPDGRPFFAMQNPPPTLLSPITHLALIENFVEQLKAKVPVSR